MGYVLPIKSIQSEQYANRMTLKPYNFAAVDSLQKVKLKSDFLENFEESLQLQYQQEKEKFEERSQSQVIPSSHLHRRYSQPNLADLSPVISQIVGKGMNINTYV